MLVKPDAKYYEYRDVCDYKGCVLILSGTVHQFCYFTCLQVHMAFSVKLMVKKWTFAQIICFHEHKNIKRQFIRLR